MSKITELEDEIEDLTVHLADMLEATMYFAGVKEANLEKAVKAYVDALDVVFEDEDDDGDGEMGYREIVKVIEYLQENRPTLFA